MSALRGIIGIIGWFISYLYIFAFFGPLVATCTMGSDDAWVASLIQVPILLLSVALVAIGWPQARWLRYMALPHIFVFILFHGIE